MVLVQPAEVSASGCLYLTFLYPGESLTEIMSFSKRIQAEKSAYSKSDTTINTYNIRPRILLHKEAEIILLKNTCRCPVRGEHLK